MVKFVNSQSNTRRGAIIATVSGIVASVGAFAIEFFPNTFFTEKYKSIVQMYKLGNEIPLNKNVEELFHKVMDDLKMKDKDKNIFEPFVVTGFNAMYIGLGVVRRYNTYIGIPINYSYTDRFAIDTSSLRVGQDQEPLNIYHPAADDLLDSLVYSEKAKKFGIAREILMAQKQLPLYKSIESPVIIIASVLASEIARIQLNLANKPKAIKVLFYLTSGFFSYSLWFQIRDTLHTYYEKTVDKELADLGPEYIEGGKEFYEKQLKRNVALRTLLGERGVVEYNKDGDELFFLRNKKTPITHRKRYFSEIELLTGNQEAA